MANNLYKHPDYYTNYENWKVAKDLYEGKRSVITSPEYLWPHAIEQKSQYVNRGLSLTDQGIKITDTKATQMSTGSAELRTAREKRTRYPGLQSVIVSLWQSLFFAKPATPTPALEELLKPHDGWKNIDGYKTSVNEFLQNKVLVSRLLYGKEAILVDSLPVAARNLAEEKELGVRPFMSLISPLDLVDWEIFTDLPKDFGKYKAIRHEYCGVRPRNSLTEAPKVRKYSHLLQIEGGLVTITENYVDLDKNGNVCKDHWNAELQTENWQESKKLATKLKELPISIYSGDAWLNDVGQEVLRHYNLRSNRDNINYNNGYDIRYAKGNFDDDRAIQALSEYTVVLLPSDGDFGKLEASDPIALEKSEKEAVENIFRVGLNKLRQIASGSKEVQAAEGQDKDNEYTFRLVEAELQSIEDSINDAFKHYAAFMGKEGDQYKVELDKEISKENIDKFLIVWNSTRDLINKVPGATAEVTKKAIKQLKLDNEDKLLSAVDSVNFEQQQDSAQDPIDKALSDKRKDNTQPGQ